jgi:hypothetical protein
MSIRAPRGARLLVAAAMAWLGLALFAQAALATYSKVQVVKVNQGGDPSDVFTFDTSLKPAASPSSFTLKGGEKSSAYGVECNVGSSCITQWGNSVQTITERAAPGYTLTSIACYHTQGSGGWPSEPNTSSGLDNDTTYDLAARKITYKVNWWEWVKCYVTNTRDTGTIKVTKKLVPATDSGKFNLLIDGAAKATNVGDGGTTGTQTVATGTHSVGESAGTGTSLADYTSSTACVDKAHGGTASGPTVNVAKGDQWECVITNTRKTGTIKVTKALSPATDTGRFNLLIAGQALATDIGDGGTTGVQTVIPGAYAVGESAGTGTDLANYTSTLSCTDTAHPGTAADTDGNVQVDAGDAWECLITNTRKSSPPPNDQPPSPAPKPGIAVSPARVKPGSAKLRGPSGCPTTAAVAATVTGRQIAKVTFYVDGKKVKTLTRANKSGGRWVLPMNVKRFAFGTHRVRVTVQFTKASQTKAKTYALSFARCHPAVVKPKFTG